MPVAREVMVNAEMSNRSIKLLDVFAGDRMLTRSDIARMAVRDFVGHEHTPEAVAEVDAEDSDSVYVRLTPGEAERLDARCKPLNWSRAQAIRSLLEEVVSGRFTPSALCAKAAP